MPDEDGRDESSTVYTAPGGPDDEAFLRLTGLMPLTAASHVVGTSPGTLRRHLATGACDGRKIGRRWYVNGGDLDRWARRHPRHGSMPRQASSSALDLAVVDCGCNAPDRRLGDRARVELETRARRVRALARFRDLEHQVAMDVLGIRGSGRLAPSCRSWLDSVVADASRDAARTGLGSLLDVLAGRLAVAPSSVLVGLDQVALQDAVELT